VRNDSISDDIKFLDIKNEGYNPLGQIWYEEYYFLVKNDWIYEKKVQL